MPSTVSSKEIQVCANSLVDEVFTFIQLVQFKTYASVLEMSWFENKKPYYLDFLAPFPKPTTCHELYVFVFYHFVVVTSFRHCSWLDG